MMHGNYGRMMRAPFETEALNDGKENKTRKVFPSLSSFCVRSEKREALLGRKKKKEIKKEERGWEFDLSSKRDGKFLLPC